MNRKILIVLADWIGHIGFLLSAGMTGWALMGLWISGPAAIGLLPVMVKALELSVLMYILYTWTDEQRLAQKSRLHIMQRAQQEADDQRRRGA